MDHVSGIGGFAPQSRWRKNALTKKGQKALSLLKDDHQVEAMINSHEDSDALRRFAERLKEKAGSSKESVAQFYIDQESGQISLRISDAQTGEVHLVLSPEEVAEGLKNLEETDDNGKPLSSFFLDLIV